MSDDDQFHPDSLPEGLPEKNKSEIRVYCDETLVQDLKIFCAFSGRKASEVGQTAIRDYLATQKMTEKSNQIKAMPAQTVAEQKEKYLAALAEKYYPILACKESGVDVALVEKWEREDEEFSARSEDARSMFIAEFEMTILFDIKGGKKVNKDAFTFWVAFQNAHNEKYGRLKAEEAARAYSDFCDLAYKVVDANFTPEQAKLVKDEMKAIASKRLQKMGG